MRYAKTENTIWQNYVFRNLSPLAQRFYIYVTSSPLSNCIGFYQLMPGYAYVDLGCTEAEFNDWMRELEDSNLIKWDQVNCVVLLVKYLEENPITNKNHFNAAAKRLRALPMTPLLDDFRTIIDQIPDHKIQSKEGKNIEYTKGLLQELSVDLSESYGKHPVTATATAAFTGTDSSRAIHPVNNPDPERYAIDETTNELYDKKTGERKF